MLDMIVSNRAINAVIKALPPNCCLSLLAAHPQRANIQAVSEPCIINLLLSPIKGDMEMHVHSPNYTKCPTMSPWSDADPYVCGPRFYSPVKGSVHGENDSPEVQSGMLPLIQNISFRCNLRYTHHQHTQTIVNEVFGSNSYHVNKPLPVLLLLNECLQHMNCLQFWLFENRRRPAFHEQHLGKCGNFLLVLSR